MAIRNEPPDPRDYRDREDPSPPLEAFGCPPDPEAEFEAWSASAFAEVVSVTVNRSALFDAQVCLAAVLHDPQAREAVCRAVQWAGFEHPEDALRDAFATLCSMARQIADRQARQYLAQAQDKGVPVTVDDLRHLLVVLKTDPHPDEQAIATARRLLAQAKGGESC
jgi:hypothetical protein